MQDDFPLTIHLLLEHGRKVYGQSECVTWEGTGARCATYAQIADNAERLAAALARLGVEAGDRVGTFCWNNQEHLEAYYAVPCMGAVLHTLNIRLPGAQLAQIVNHAEDKLIIVDSTLLPLLAAVADQLSTVEAYIVIGDGDASGLGSKPTYRYAELLAAEEPGFAWPVVDERAPASMCYTSGTTGDPKGVVYSHRSSLLHALTVTQADTIALSERDVAMPLVPMFHVNCWGLPHAGTLVGCKLVLPGRFMTPDRTAQAMVDEGVTLSAGVPTLWLGLLQVMAQRPDLKFPKLNRVVIGGSACPVSLIQALEANGIPVLHAWGMTETSPIGTVSRLLSTLEDLP